MDKIRFLPRLAINSIKKSAPAYLPYILATSFAVFVFFIFGAISSNPIMKTFPHAGYLLLLMEVGKVLLGIILVPFLFYTNSFLMKRRKKELGLYSILGLEKRHIGFIISAETFMVCIISLILGIVFALVFSRLIFVMLLNITGLPVEIAFTANLESYISTLKFFGSIFFLNLIINIFQVSKTKPSDLFQSARHGEKQPKHLWPSTVLGISSLGFGYYLAINFELDSNFIFVFFGAILLVIVGTYCLFTSGIITLLRFLKKNKNYYYKKGNFVTISGMLYRMRKNAASLSNICIFSTMVIITLVCTVSLFKGLDHIASYKYPYDVDIRFLKNEFNLKNELMEKIASHAENTNTTVEDFIEFEYFGIALEKDGSSFKWPDNPERYPKTYSFRILSLDEYNAIEGTEETLSNEEALFFSTGKNQGFKEVQIGNTNYKIKKELESLKFESKEPLNLNEIYYLIVSDKDEQKGLYDKMNVPEDKYIYTVRFNIAGEKENKEKFISNMSLWAEDAPGYYIFDNRISGEKDDTAILGGLLFLGIFFGIIFLVCMVMIMYYKQLSEGYEDKNNYDVMQQVGMSESEVKHTISRQIITVFFLPLIMAFLHTSMALRPVEVMLRTLNLYSHKLIVLSTVGVSIAFAIVYVVSYYLTAKAYYKIVRR